MEFRETVTSGVVRHLLSEGKTLSLRVLGSSMPPFIRPGSEVRLRRADRYRLGDLIVIETPSGAVLHRYFGRGFAGRWRGFLIAKGDGAMRFDPVSPEAVIGVVGPAHRHRDNPLIRSLAVTLSLTAAMFLWSRYLLLKSRNGLYRR